MDKAIAGQRRKRDIAYACFLPSGLVSLIDSLRAFVAGSPATVPYGDWLGILTLLMLVGVVMTPVGLYYSVMLWRDGALLVLSILTLFMVATAVTTDADSMAFYDAMSVVHGVGVLIVVSSWFLLRRRRVGEGEKGAV